MKTPNRPKGRGIFQQHREFSMFAIPRIEKYQTQSPQAVGYRKQMKSNKNIMINPNLDKMLRKSTLTEEDAERIGHKLKHEMRKKYKN